MQVKIKLNHPDAKTPTYATEGAACFDLHAAECGPDWKEQGYHAEFDTGLAFELPENHVMLVFSRSGFGFKHDATLANSVGVIDSDYRGNVKVKYNKGIQAKAGDRIAQAIILPYEKITFQTEEELNETERGEDGFGSTGVK